MDVYDIVPQKHLPSFYSFALPYHRGMAQSGPFVTAVKMFRLTS